MISQGFILIHYTQLADGLLILHLENGCDLDILKYLIALKP